MKNQTAANPAYVNFLNFFDRTIPAVALEPFRREFGLDDTSAGLYVAAGIPLGYLTDRYNHHHDRPDYLERNNQRHRHCMELSRLWHHRDWRAIRHVRVKCDGRGTRSRDDRAFRAEGLHFAMLIVMPFGMPTPQQSR